MFLLLIPLLFSLLSSISSYLFSLSFIFHLLISLLFLLHLASPHISSLLSFIFVLLISLLFSPSSSFSSYLLSSLLHLPSPHISSLLALIPFFSIIFLLFSPPSCVSSYHISSLSPSSFSLYLFSSPPIKNNLLLLNSSSPPPPLPYSSLFYLQHRPVPPPAHFSGQLSKIILCKKSNCYRSPTYLSRRPGQATRHKLSIFQKLVKIF